MSALVRISALLLLLPLPVLATSGAWSGKSHGGIVSRGQQILVSHPLTPPAGLSARAITTRIQWRITLLAPPPLALRIKLCTPERCLPLPGLSGKLNQQLQLSPHGPFRFIYSVQHKGQLMPALNVVSNQLTISYRESGQ